jgi:ketosteroid isomerase-like protein
VSANLDLVRSIFAGWERGEYGATKWADPEIEFVVADGPSPGRWTGLAGMAESVRADLKPFRDASQTAEGFRELDEQRVLVLNRYTAQGKTSGLTVRAKGANLFHIVDGRVIRLVHYWDRDQALADLRLKG